MKLDDTVDDFVMIGYQELLDERDEVLFNVSLSIRYLLLVD